jgi:predicted glutamine amidotransferase
MSDRSAPLGNRPTPHLANGDGHGIAYIHGESKHLFRSAIVFWIEKRQ